MKKKVQFFCNAVFRCRNILIMMAAIGSGWYFYSDRKPYLDLAVSSFCLALTLLFPSKTFFDKVFARCIDCFFMSASFIGLSFTLYYFLTSRIYHASDLMIVVSSSWQDIAAFACDIHTAIAFCGAIFVASAWGVCTFAVRRRLAVCQPS